MMFRTAPDGLGDLGRFRFRAPRFVQNVTRRIVASPGMKLTKRVTQRIVASPGMKLTKRVTRRIARSPGGRLTRRLARNVRQLTDPRLVRQDIRKNKKTIRAVLAVVAIIVAAYFTGGAALKYLAVLYEMQQKRQQQKKVSQADQAKEQQAEQGLRSEMLNSGYSDAQADQVVEAMRAGQDPAAALQELGPPPGNEEVSIPSGEAGQPSPGDSGAAVATGDPMVSRAQFLKWFQSWNPNAAAALMESHPELFSVGSAPAPAGMAGFDDDSGDYAHHDGTLGDLTDDLSSWVDAFGQAASSVLNTVGEAKLLQVQLQRARSAQPPLPTQQAQRVAAGAIALPGGLTLSPAMLLGGAALLLGGVFLATRR